MNTKKVKIENINNMQSQVLVEEKEKIKQERENLVLMKEKLQLEIKLLKRKSDMLDEE